MLPRMMIKTLQRNLFVFHIINVFARIEQLDHPNAPDRYNCDINGSLPQYCNQYYCLSLRPLNSVGTSPETDYMLRRQSSFYQRQNCLKCRLHKKSRDGVLSFFIIG